MARISFTASASTWNSRDGSREQPHYFIALLDALGRPPEESLVHCRFSTIFRHAAVSMKIIQSLTQCDAAAGVGAKFFRCNVQLGSRHNPQSSPTNRRAAAASPRSCQSSQLTATDAAAPPCGS